MDKQVDAQVQKCIMDLNTAYSSLSGLRLMLIANDDKRGDLIEYLTLQTAAMGGALRNF